MKKNLLAIGLLAASYSVQAQNVLLHVDNSANMYVSEGTLVYNGGGLQTRGTGIIDLHGNMMIEGLTANNDVVRTVTTGGGVKSDGSNIVLRLNNPVSAATSTYGQLYINGLTQAAVTATVSKEFRTPSHGTGNYFQQVALPFSGKVLSSLSTELNKTFGTTRFTQNEILKYNNQAVVSDHYTNLTTTTIDPTGYYMLGSKNNNLNTATPPAAWPTIAPAPTGSVYTLNGIPYAPLAADVTLQNAGNSVNFGPGGNALNQYNEKYYTYLQDQFEGTATPWSGTYGKNIYQFGNPFLTNLDLSRIGYTEASTPNDGNNVSNIWGVRYDPGVVTTLSNGGSYSTGALIQTFNNTPNVGVPVGDVGLIIKPMQSFVIKLRNNTPQTLNFNTLRRFSNTVRAATTGYSVAAAKNAGTSTASTGSSLKQLGVIALDATGKEIARTYYVVSPELTTGHQTSVNTTVQAACSTVNVLGTFEEAPTGGWDSNYLSSYWLYINEANENNFLGKNIKLANYDYGVTNNAVSYKFEIRENAELVPQGTHTLSAGVGFYYKAPNGTVQQVNQGDVIPITGDLYDLYYGAPANVLSISNTAAKPSRTIVVYNPDITNYIVRFDPNWKKADIQVYDMSGKLVISKKAVSTSTDFVIELDNAVKNSYVVKVVADNGEVVNAKILK